MKILPISQILRINAILLIAAGIAFALYGPLMMALFTIPELQIDADIYWQIAAFARMYGAVLFAFGLLVYALREAFPLLPVSSQRKVLASLILANLMGAFVSITQTASIWGTLAGWITTGFFALFTILYIVSIAGIPSEKSFDQESQSSAGQDL